MVIPRPFPIGFAKEIASQREQFPCQPSTQVPKLNFIINPPKFLPLKDAKDETLSAVIGFIPALSSRNPR